MRYMGSYALGGSRLPGSRGKKRENRFQRKPKRTTEVDMFVFARAVTYAALFNGFVLAYLPGRPLCLVNHTN